MSLSEFKYLDYRDLNAINVEELNILNLEPVNISFRHFRGQNLVKKILFFKILIFFETSKTIFRRIGISNGHNEDAFSQKYAADIVSDCLIPYSTNAR